jgi:hypothetical protein
MEFICNPRLTNHRFSNQSDKAGCDGGDRGYSYSPYVSSSKWLDR